MIKTQPIIKFADGSSKDDLNHFVWGDIEDETYCGLVGVHGRWVKADEVNCCICIEIARWTGDCKGYYN